METAEQHWTNPIIRFFSDITSKKAILIISILGIVVFGNSLGNGFVGDDMAQIVSNYSVHSASNIFRFFSGSTFYNTGSQLGGLYYKPLLSTTYSLIFTVFGSRAVAFHAFSIFFHLVVTSLLFLILARFFRKPLSLILSLIFLVHPLNSEVVYYISDLQDSLFMFFGLLGLYKIFRIKSTNSIIIASIFFFLSVLSKETGVLFFPLALIYIYTYERKYLYQLLAILSFTILIYLGLRMNAIGIFVIPDNAPIATLNLTERILHIPSIIFFYIKTFIFPLHLSVSWHWTIRSLTLRDFYLPLLVDILTLGLIVYFGAKLYKQKQSFHFKSYLFFSLWLLVGLLIHLQIVPLDATVADRWFYFTMAGSLGIVGTLLQVYNIRLTNKDIIIIVIAILGILSVRTFIRGFDWRNNFILYSHDVKVSDSFVLENGISYELAEMGHYNEARVHAERSIELFPYFINYNSLGNAYVFLADYQKAQAAYKKALEYSEYYQLYNNLGFIYVTIDGDEDEEIEFIKKGIKLYPENSNLWFYLAILQYKIDRVSEAKNSILNAQKYNYNNNIDIKKTYNAIILGQPLDLDLRP